MPLNSDEINELIHQYASTIKHHIEKASRGSAPDRLAAIRVLIENDVSPRVIIPFLVDIVCEGQPEESSYATDLLVPFGEQVIPEIIRCINDKDRYTRQLVAWTLREIGGESVWLPMLELLDDKSYEVRQLVGDYLLKQTDRDLLGVLVPRLHHSNPDIQGHSIELLGQLGETEYLVSLLDSNNPLVLDKALRVLFKHRRPECFEFSADILRDNSHEYLQSDAVEYLGELGDEQYLGVLIDKLGNLAFEDHRFYSPNLRLDIINALAKIGGTKAIAAIIAFLQNHEITRQEAEILAECKDAQAIEFLIQNDVNEKIKPTFTLVKMFGEIGDYRLIPILIALLNDDTKEHFTDSEVKPLPPYARKVPYIEVDISWGSFGSDWYYIVMSDVALASLEKINSPEADEAVKQYKSRE